MTYLSKLSAAAATTALVLAASSAASAVGNVADQKVDGSFTIGDIACSWTGGSTNANPPNSLTVDRSTVNQPGGNLSCGEGASGTLNNDPTFTFDDANALATSDTIDISGSQGVSCRYSAANVQWDRQGTTRQYTNRAFTAQKVSGGPLCPGTVDADPADASVTFN
ncbi:hypothetical protein [Streptomyces luteolus]|uniref:Ig-like domain-containing protein n=1 Tax=Streptomyces luteolus TaxID=3043615 RepID=A0ABT6SR31_9ACTN|nr:hypothetical protein [Streptomyces sp. B-S-A12]MDI3417578.1 hypothetical protein [Streptomyces sp. B-S-A12]